MSNFTSSLALSLLESADEFPVDFDQAMQWWDCKTQSGKLVRRDNLFRKLRENFEEGRDYLSLKSEGEDRPQGGRSVADQIFLTVDCFKSFGMMVSGRRGQEIRAYFIACEKRLKQSAIAEGTVTDRMVADIVTAIKGEISSEVKAQIAEYRRPTRKSKPNLQIFLSDDVDRRTEEEKARERQEIFDLVKTRRRIF